MGEEFLRNLKNIDTVWLANLTKRFSSTLCNLLSLHISLLIHDGLREISEWKGTEKNRHTQQKNSKINNIKNFLVKTSRQTDR